MSVDQLEFAPFIAMAKYRFVDVINSYGPFKWRMVHTAVQIHGPHIDAESAASPSAEIQRITMHMMADNFAEESKPSSEWIEQWHACTDRIAALESSDNPLQQLLTNIEVLDSTLCLMGQMLMDEHD